jgi:hypothetical protein
MKFFGRGKQATQSFIGFRHTHGVGIRTKYYVIPLSRGASGFARALAEDASLTLIENSATSSNLAAVEEVAHSFLPKLAQHKHTAGIFIVALGDEPVRAVDVASAITALGVACEYLVINNYPSIEVATNLAMATAQELKTMSLSGLDRINPGELTIAYRQEPALLDELVALLEKNGFAVNRHQMTGSRRDELSSLAISDAHAILSFVGDDEYPTGTLITPVINVAQKSALHQKLIEQFDLSYTATSAEILAEVQQVFGMVPTFTETAGIFEPLFASNAASLNDVDEADEICLIPVHPALTSFLIDLVSHQAGLFLKDWESAAAGKINARKILLIATGSSSDHFFGIFDGDVRAETLRVSECGSFQGLATAIVAHI